MTNYATRIWNDDFEERKENIIALSNTFGCKEIKDRGRIVFFVFDTRQQAKGYADEIYESYHISVKVLEWF